MVRTLKALGYFREDGGRSSKPGRAPADAVDSLADQNRAFLEFCKQEGHEVAATFLDTAAEKDDFSGFRQLLEYLKRQRGAPCLVVVTSVDRLGRDAMQATRCLYQIDGLGGKLVTLDGKPDPAASLLEHWVKTERSPDVGDRVREAMRRKAIRGEVLGRPPYGYQVGPKHRLEPVPDEAPVIRYIFRLYTREGLGIRLIARRLNEEGFRTRRDGNWSMVTIRDILLNRAYLGTYTRFGVRVPGSHTALISPEDFRRVQDRMASRRTGGGERRVRQYLLSGLAYCGYCGNKMIGVSRRQTWKRRGDGSEGEAEYRYYQCLSRTNQSMCDYHTWRAGILEEEVRRQAAAAIVEALAGADSAEIAGPTVEVEVEKLRVRLRKLDRTLEQHMHAAAAQEMSMERLRELSVELTQQQMETDDALRQLEGRRKIVESFGDQRRARATVLEALTTGWQAADFAASHALIRQTVARVTVLDDGALVRTHV
ncbi:MAG TPA: recombinase family protein [Dehalococcoidia bacterium]